MSTPRVLDVGNCDADHSMIRRMLEAHFHVEIDQVMFVDQALMEIRQRPYALVLFNRLIFDDGSDGIGLLTAAKADIALRHVPMMMISNFPDAQAASARAGGEPGFGKAAMEDAKTAELLAKYLPPMV